MLELCTRRQVHAPGFEQQTGWCGYI